MRFSERQYQLAVSTRASCAPPRSCAEQICDLFSIGAETHQYAFGFNHGVTAKRKYRDLIASDRMKSEKLSVYLAKASTRI